MELNEFDINIRFDKIKFIYSKVNTYILGLYSSRIPFIIWYRYSSPHTYLPYKGRINIYLFDNGMKKK